MTHRDLCMHGETPDVDAVGLRVQLGAHTAIDNVSLRARGGNVTGLLGPNGSGKTTLLHVLAGLRTPDRGTVQVGEADVHAMPHRTRAKTVALVEQHAASTSDLTVRQVVTLGRLPHRGPLGIAGRDRRGEQVVEQVLDLVGLELLADRGWSTLSGGERQRAHLARTLAQEPQVLLLDEPTNHLDLGQQLRFMSLARELGLTTIAALHDLELATAYCDDLVVLDQGSTRAQGPVDTTLTPKLLADVYRVHASVESHPRSGRAHFVWDGPVDERVRRDPSVAQIHGLESSAAALGDGPIEVGDGTDADLPKPSETGARKLVRPA